MSTVQYFKLEEIEPNPWQTRSNEDPEHVAQLVASFQSNAALGLGEKGMMQVPTGRIPSGTVGHVQLAFGMTRFAAWKIANPTELFPVRIETLTNLQMATQAAGENGDRKDLSGVETAKGIQRLVTDFGLSKLDAGKAFGYHSESTVNKKLELLQLPEPIQALVDLRQISERNARTLVTISRINPEKATKLAVSVTAAGKKTGGNVEEWLDEQISDVMDKECYSLEEAPWEMDWPKKMLPLEQALAKDAGLDTLPACKGCPFLFQRKGQAHCGCGRPECFQAKLKARMPDLLAETSRKLGIPTWTESDGDLTPLQYDRYDYPVRSRVEKSVTRKLSHLRLIALMPSPKEAAGSAFGRRQATGSLWIALGTLDPAAMKTYLAHRDDSPNARAKAPEKKKNETKKEAAARIKEAERLAIARRKERSSANANKWHVLWLTRNAVKEIAARLPIDGSFATFVDNLVDEKFHVGGRELREQEQALLKVARGAVGPEAVKLHKEHIALLVAGELSSDWNGHYKPLAEVHAALERLCGAYTVSSFKDQYSTPKRLGIVLPTGWDRIPVQHTDFNCWECDDFAPSEKLTQTDKRLGWISAGPGKGTFCPKHKARLAKPALYQQGHGKKRARK